MDQKLIKMNFLNALGLAIKKFGFPSKCKGQSYVAKTNFGKKSIHVSFIPHKTNIDLTIDVAIRFDDIENLINEDMTILTEKEKLETFTIGGELGNLKEFVPKRWRLERQEQIVQLIPNVVQEIENVGIPFLEKYSDRSALLNLLSKDDKFARICAPFNSYRAKSALIITFLMNDYDRFKELAEYKIRFLSEVNDPELEEIKHFGEKLKLRFQHR